MYSLYIYFKLPGMFLRPLVIPYMFSSKRYVVRSVFFFWSAKTYVNILILFISFINISYFNVNFVLNQFNGENKTDCSISANVK